MRIGAKPMDMHLRHAKKLDSQSMEGNRASPQSTCSALKVHWLIISHFAHISHISHFFALFRTFTSTRAGFKCVRTSKVYASFFSNPLDSAISGIFTSPFTRSSTDVDLLFQPWPASSNSGRLLVIRRPYTLQMHRESPRANWILLNVVNAASTKKR